MRCVIYVDKFASHKLYSIIRQHHEDKHHSAYIEPIDEDISYLYHLSDYYAIAVFRILLHL